MSKVPGSRPISFGKNCRDDGQVVLQWRDHYIPERADTGRKRLDDPAASSLDYTGLPAGTKKR